MDHCRDGTQRQLLLWAQGTPADWHRATQPSFFPPLRRQQLMTPLRGSIGQVGGEREGGSPAEEEERWGWRKMMPGGQKAAAPELLLLSHLAHSSEHIWLQLQLPTPPFLLHCAARKGGAERWSCSHECSEERARQLKSSSSGAAAFCPTGIIFSCPCRSSSTAAPPSLPLGRWSPGLVSLAGLGMDRQEHDAARATEEKRRTVWHGANLLVFPGSRGGSCLWVPWQQ